MATPLLYRGILYVVSSRGVLTAFEPRTGVQIYQQRLAPGGYSASPVAADGRIYIAGEDGQIFTIRAGRTFEILATSAMNEPTMATPALAGHTLFVRTEHWVWALADRTGRSPVRETPAATTTSWQPRELNALCHTTRASADVSPQAGRCVITPQIGACL